MPYRKWGKLPHDVYIETKRFIRTYPKLINKYDSIVGASPSNDGQPRGTAIGHPTENTAINLMDVSIKLDCIHKALNEIPECYQVGVFKNIVYHEPFPECLTENSWRVWEHRYVFIVRCMLDEKGL